MPQLDHISATVLLNIVDIGQPNWLVQLIKGVISLAQTIPMGLEIDLGSMDGKKKHLKYSIHIQHDTLYLICILKVCLAGIPIID